jgi:hypothetical protein
MIKEYYRHCKITHTTFNNIQFMQLICTVNTQKINKLHSKGTKNNRVYLLPFSSFLHTLLLPFLHNQLPFNNHSLGQLTKDTIVYEQIKLLYNTSIKTI